VRVIDGVADSRVRYRGEIDVQEILRSFHPTGPTGQDDPMPKIRRLGYGYLSAAKGEMTVPRASYEDVMLWSIQELAPWLLAAIVLVLLTPVLRAAERGDPFREGASLRLRRIGLLLLAGIPGIVIFDYLAAFTESEGAFVSPSVEPTVTLSVMHFLPGVLVLVLAEAFRRGAELRDLDRHTI
jgi:membrane protease YdiL (CAAX protease family)